MEEDESELPDIPMEVEDVVITETEPAGDEILPETTTGVADINEIISFQAVSLVPNQDESDPLQIQNSSLEEDEIEGEGVDASQDADSFSTSQTFSTGQPATSTKCLICCAPCESTCELKSETLETGTSPSKSNLFSRLKTEGGGDRDVKGGKVVLDSRNGIMFVIHKLLLFPNSVCEELLETYGNPSKWGATCCKDCFTMLEEAQEVSEKLVNNKMILKCIQEKVKDDILISAENQEEEDDAVDQLSASLVTQDIRNRFIQKSKEEGVTISPAAAARKRRNKFSRSEGQAQTEQAVKLSSILPDQAPIGGEEACYVDLGLVKQPPPSDDEEGYDDESLGMFGGGDMEDNDEWNPGSMLEVLCKASDKEDEEGEDYGDGGSGNSSGGWSNSGSDDDQQDDSDDDDDEDYLSSSKKLNRSKKLIKCPDCPMRFQNVRNRDSHHRQRHPKKKSPAKPKKRRRAKAGVKRRAKTRAKSQVTKKKKISSDHEGDDDNHDHENNEVEGEEENYGGAGGDDDFGVGGSGADDDYDDGDGGGGDNDDEDYVESGTSGMPKTVKKKKPVVKKRKRPARVDDDGDFNRSSGGGRRERKYHVKCSQCPKHFPTEHFRDAHERRIHLGIKLCFICGKCGKGYERNIQLEAHGKWCNGSAQEPGRPRVSLKTPKKQVQRSKSEDEADVDSFCEVPKSVRGNERKYLVPCTKCPQYFPSEHFRNAHIRRRHLGIKLCFICERCGKAYERNQMLELHKRNCDGDGTFVHPEPRLQEREVFKCPKCPRPFPSEIRRDAHVKRFHEGEQKPFQCKTCPRRFVSPKFLLEHEGKCTGLPFERKKKIVEEKKKEEMVGEFHCTVQGCTRIFKYKKFLDKHVEAHNDPKSYICHICAQPFTAASNLNRHLLRHRDPDYPRRRNKGKRDWTKGSKKKNKSAGRGENSPVSSASYARSEDVDVDDDSEDSEEYHPNHEALLRQNHEALVRHMASAAAAGQGQSPRQQSSGMSNMSREGERVQTYQVPQDLIMANYSAPGEYHQRGHGQGHSGSGRGNHSRGNEYHPNVDPSFLELLR